MFVVPGTLKGTPAVTTQGLVETDMKSVASLIGRAVRASDDAMIAEIATEVSTLVAAKPAYARS